MSGLNLMGGAQVTARAQARAGTVAAPATASAAAFGTSLTPAHSATALAPTNPGGLAFWIGIAGVAVLGLLYWSLPG